MYASFVYLFKLFRFDFFVETLRFPIHFGLYFSTRNNTVTRYNWLVRRSYKNEECDWSLFRDCIMRVVES